jgi:ferredoxin-NADP reductase
VTAAAVLIWRVALPVWRSTRHALRVTSVVPETPGIVSVYLSGRRLDRLPVEAGQFCSWRFLSGPGWTRSHPYSLSAAPDGRSLRITVQVVGDGSAVVTSLRPGTRVLIEGPYGRLSARARTRRRVVMIGAGVGTAPLRALAEGLAYTPGDAVYVERYTDVPLFAREIDTLARERGLRVLRLPGHRRSADSWLGGTPGLAGVSDLDALRSWIPDLAERDVYVCGPDGWTDLVRRDLTGAGLPDDRLHLETFSW